MPDLEQIWKNVKANVLDLAKTMFSDFKEEAVNDVTVFLNKTKTDIGTWTMQLSHNEITKAEFESNVAGLKDLAEMMLLHNAGIALIRIDEFKKNLYNTIVNTVTAFIKI
jgi:hypothetical protein